MPAGMFTLKLMYKSSANLARKNDLIIHLLRIKLLRKQSLRVDKQGNWNVSEEIEEKHDVKKTCHAAQFCFQTISRSHDHEKLPVQSCAV